MRVLVLSLFMVALPACPHNGPAPSPTPRAGDMAPSYPLCQVPDGGVLPTYRDVCSGKVTRDHRACVKCQGMHGCLDATDVVYCVKGDKCDDPACAPDLDAADGAVKKSALQH